MGLLCDTSSFFKPLSSIDSRNIFQTEEALVTSCDENYTEQLKAATGRFVQQYAI